MLYLSVEKPMIEQDVHVPTQQEQIEEAAGVPFEDLTPDQVDEIAGELEKEEEERKDQQGK